METDPADQHSQAQLGTSAPDPPSDHAATRQINDDDNTQGTSQPVESGDKSESSNVTVLPAGLSKNAQKRLLKNARYEAGREDRIKRNKDRRAAKRESLRAAIASGTASRPVRTSLPRQTPSNLRIIIDCSFDALMNDREIKSVCAQLTRCYAENRVARCPCNLIMTSWNDAVAARFSTVFQNQQLKWKNVRIFEQEYLTTAEPESDGRDGTDGKEVIVDGIDKADLVYLSADAEDTVHEIDETKVYIIGGIVDKNRYKGLCQDKAAQQGIKTAKLPIGEYIKMASRKVLTVNHVFEIMSRWLETRDWEKAFLSVIPKRKLPSVTGPSSAVNAPAGTEAPLINDEEQAECDESDADSDIAAAVTAEG